MSSRAECLLRLWPLRALFWVYHSSLPFVLLTATPFYRYPMSSLFCSKFDRVRFIETGTYKVDWERYRVYAEERLATTVVDMNVVAHWRSTSVNVIQQAITRMELSSEHVQFSDRNRWWCVDQPWRTDVTAVERALVYSSTCAKIDQTKIRLCRRCRRWPTWFAVTTARKKWESTGWFRWPSYPMASLTEGQRSIEMASLSLHFPIVLAFRSYSTLSRGQTAQCLSGRFCNLWASNPLKLESVCSISERALHSGWVISAATNYSWCTLE